MNAPPDSRLFVGNLASEKTTKEEMRTIFSKYGNVLEVVLLSSFGFVQYDSPESARQAVAGEQSRMIGGLTIDLSIADNRPRGGGGRGGRKRGRSADRDRGRSTRRRSRSRERERDRYGASSSSSSRRDYGPRDPRERERERSRPSSSSRDRERRRSRSRERERRPRFDLTRLVCIVHLHPDQRRYADDIRARLRHALDVGSDVRLAPGGDIPLALRDAREAGYPFALVMGQENERDRTVRFNVLHERVSVVELHYDEIVDAVARAAGLRRPSSSSSSHRRRSRSRSRERHRVLEAPQGAPSASAVANLLAILQSPQSYAPQPYMQQQQQPPPPQSYYPEYQPQPYHPPPPPPQQQAAPPRAQQSAPPPQLNSVDMSALQSLLSKLKK